MLTICGLVAGLCLHAQFFTNYGTSDGLSNQSIASMMQDRQGFMWIATEDGLNRFDGNEFKQYHYDPQDSTSLPHDDVDQMAQAPDGYIWFSSTNGKLARYDPWKDEFLTWEELTGTPDPTRGLATAEVLCYTSDSIFVGCNSLGVVLFEPSRKRTTVIGEDGIRTIRGAKRIKPTATDSNKAWVLIEDRIQLLDLRTCKYLPHDLPERPYRDKEHWIFHDVHQDEHGTVWLCSWGGGLWEAAPGDPVWRVHTIDGKPPTNGSKNIFLTICAASPTRYLVASEEGVVTLEPGQGITDIIKHDPDDPHSLAPGRVTLVMTDRNGVTWIGTELGLSVLDPAKNTLRTLPIANPAGYPNPRPIVNGIVELGDRYFIGTALGEGGLIFDRPEVLRLRRTGEVRKLHKLEIRGIERTRDHGTIAFTSQGLFKVDPVTLEAERAYESVFQRYGGMYQLGFLEDHRGEIWIGSQHRGLYHWDPRTGFMERIDGKGPEGRRLSGTWPMGIAEDRDHRIWVSAQDAGLIRISADRMRIDHFLADSLTWLPTRKVWDLAIDGRDRLWIATNGEGIIITPAQDPGGAGTVQLAAREGISSKITSVFIDAEDDAWAAGPSGLYRISGKDLSVRRLDRHEGLRQAKFHHADIRQHPSGLITVVYDLGEVLFIDPKNIPELTAPAHVFLKDIKVNGTLWDTDTVPAMLHALELPHDQNFLRIDYGAISTSLRGRILLQHRLEGLDLPPIPTGAEGTAVYTGLPPGTYRFVVEQELHGQWSEVSGLNILIAPAYWQTWWFRLLVVLMLVAVVGAFAQWRLGIMRGKERLRIDLNKRIAEVEMNALRAQMNPHFLFNSLNSINRYIVHNEPRVASEYLTKFSRLMRSVLQNSEKQQVSLKDELEALKLYVEMEALRFKDRFTFESRVEVEDDIEQVLIPPLLLQPYVENAIWHGLMHRKGGGGKLSLRVSRNAGILLFEIEDNGVGRKRSAELKSKSATHKRSMGMRITSDRMQLARSMFNLNTEVRIIDLYDAAQKPCGTKVIISMHKTTTT